MKIKPHYHEEPEVAPCTPTPHMSYYQGTPNCSSYEPTGIQGAAFGIFAFGLLIMGMALVVGLCSGLAHVGKALFK